MTTTSSDLPQVVHTATPASSETPTPKTLRSALERAFNSLTPRHECQEIPIALPTGFADLDRIVGGFWPGELALVTALPGAGATTFALNVASFASAALRKTVVYFSLDQRADELALRLIAMHSGIDLTLLRAGQMLREDWMACGEAIERLGGSQPADPRHPLDRLR